MTAAAQQTGDVWGAFAGALFAVGFVLLVFGVGGMILWHLDRSGRYTLRLDRQRAIANWRWRSTTIGVAAIAVALVVVATDPGAHW
jgi:hypothetical protein